MALELLSQKKKYWSKVLKESAIWANTLRTVDTDEHFTERAWAETMYFLWVDISSLFIFGLEPYELEPLDPEFEIELPTPEEYSQGIKFKAKPVDVEKVYQDFNREVAKREVPPKLDFDTFVQDTCAPEYEEQMQKQKYRKLIFGVTKYGEGYLDPPVIRDLIRSTLYELAKRRLDFERIRKIYETLVEKGLVSKGVAEAIYNRLVHHFTTLYNTFVLDYNLLNYSKLAPSPLIVGKSYYGTSYLCGEKEKAEKATLVPVATWKGEFHTSKIKKMDEVNVGLILNVTPLNYGILMDRKQIYKPMPKAKPTVEESTKKPEKGTPMPSTLIDWKVRRMRARYSATGVAFGNYQRPEESFNFHKCERADQYYSTRLLFKHLDDIIENFLANKDIDAYKKNMYKRAVAMLIGHRKKRHKWGYKAYKSMSEEEFKEWWISYWTRQGLDINILNSLYQLVKRCLQPLRDELENLGKRLAQRRKQLAQSLLS